MKEDDDIYVPTSEDDREEEYLDHVPTKTRKLRKACTNSDEDNPEKKRRARHSFTNEEEERLKEGVIKFKRVDGSIDWKKVTHYVNPNLTLRLEIIQVHF